MRNKEKLILAAVLSAYCAGFFFFYPAVMTNTDEADYIRLANAFAHGKLAVEEQDPFSNEVHNEVPGIFAPGTAMLMTPFIRFFGWRGAYLASLLGVVATVVMLSQWLSEQGYSRLFGLLLLSYPPFLVLGRVGNSDIPSIAAVTLVFWLFWKGLDRAWPLWLASGLVASLSLLFREPNAFLYIVLFSGALVRRNPRTWALVVGGVAGLVVYFLCEYAVHGNIFNRSTQLDDFQLANLISNAPYYLIAFMVFIPAGLVTALFYRGPRRPEVIGTIILFIGFLVFFSSITVAGGFVNKLILHAPRFGMSLAPILIFAMAEVVPRWWSQARPALPSRLLVRVPFFQRALLGAWIAGLLALTFAVHPIFYHWSESRGQIIRAIADHTEPGAVLITNGLGTSKFINEVYMDRIRLDLDHNDAGKPEIERIARFHNSIYLVILFRTDSEFWKQRGQIYDRHTKGLAKQMNLEKVFDHAFTSTDTLRIWKVTL